MTAVVVSSMLESSALLLYSCGHMRTFDYRRIPLFWACLSFKFSVTIWENTFGYKRTPKLPKLLFISAAYDRENSVYTSCMANILDIHKIYTNVFIIVSAINQAKFRFSSTITGTADLLGYTFTSAEK